MVLGGSVTKILERLPKMERGLDLTILLVCCQFYPAKFGMGKKKIGMASRPGQ